MAFGKLTSFLKDSAKNNKILGGLAFTLLMTLAAQQGNAQNVGGVGIGTPNPQATLHIANNLDKAGLIIDQVDSTAVPNLTDGHFIRHTDGHYYYRSGAQRFQVRNTDNQQIQSFSLAGTDLTLTLENGGTATVDLSSLSSGGVPQTLSITGTNLTISGGNTIDLSNINTDNQQLTSLTLVGNTLGLALQNGGSVSVDLSQYINTDNQQLTSATLLGNVLTIVLQNGGSVSIDLSSINTDSQTLSLVGNNLSISNGNTIDLSGYVNTDNQNLTSATLTSGTLTIGIQNGNPVSVDLSALIGTDNQNLTSATLVGSILTIAIQNGNPVSVDLSSLSGGAPQTLSLTGNTLAISNGNTVDLSGYVNTDNQNLTSATLTSGTLTIGIQNGNPVSVDLSSLLGTDNQQLTSATLSGSTLTIALQNGGSVSVDLSSLSGGAPQTISLVGNNLSISNGNTIDISSINTDNQTLNLTGNNLSISNGNTIDLSGYVNTDNQQLQTATLTGNTLTITLQNGGSASVNLAGINTDNQQLTGATLSGSTLTVNLQNGGSASVNLASINTDSQTLSLVGNNLSISNGNTIDLSGYVNTDNQNLTSATLTSGTLTIGIQNGNPVSVDLSSLIGTDNQNLTSATLTGTTLTIAIQNGASVSVNLASLNTDNQTLSITGTNLTIAGGNTVNLAGINTDNQTLNLTGNNLSISNGNTINLSGYVNTDNQQLTSATLSGSTLTIALQNGGSVAVDLASINTDNQQLTSATLSGNILTIVLQNGGSASVDLSALSGASKWTLDGTKLYPNSATHNVSVGKTTPNDLNKFTVVGNAIIGNDAFTNNTVSTITPAQGNLAVQGTISIGTPSPTERFHMSGGNIRVQTLAAANGGFINTNSTGVFGKTDFSAILTNRYLNENGSRQTLPWTKTNNYLYTTTLSDSIGIGKTTPGQKFDLFDGKFRFSTTGTTYADMALNEATRTWTLSIKPAAGAERTLIDVDGSNNRVSLGFNPEDADATLFIDADVNPDDNGLVVDHRAPTPSSGTPVPAVKILANQTQTDAIALQTEDGNVIIKDGNVYIDCDCRAIINGIEQPRRFGNIATDPVSGMVPGDYYYNTTLNQWRSYNGNTNSWQAKTAR